MKKAIVTGASGFIGSAFVEFLVSHGIEVLAIGRKSLNEIQQVRRSRLKACLYVSLELDKIGDLIDYVDEVQWDLGDDCVFINLAWGGIS